MDEMRRLDLLIRLRVLREHHKNPPDLLDQFRGLVLSDEEIARLLTVPEESHADDTPINHRHQEQQECIEALSQLEGPMQQRLATSTQHGGVALVAHAIGFKKKIF